MLREQDVPEEAEEEDGNLVVEKATVGYNRGILPLHHRARFKPANADALSAGNNASDA